MQEVIGQLGALFLASLPTLILFILLVLSYQFLVQGPLGRILKERRARTAGAVEEASKAIAAAEAKAADYANKLRQARADRLQQWMQERDAALDSARKAAVLRVLEAKAGLETEAAESRKTLLAGVDQLAEQIVRAVLPATAGGSR